MNLYYGVIAGLAEKWRVNVDLLYFPLHSVVN